MGKYLQFNSKQLLFSEKKLRLIFVLQIKTNFDITYHFLLMIKLHILMKTIVGCGFIQKALYV